MIFIIDSHSLNQMHKISYGIFHRKINVMTRKRFNNDEFLIFNFRCIRLYFISHCVRLLFIYFSDLMFYRKHFKPWSANVLCSVWIWPMLFVQVFFLAFVIHGWQSTDRKNCWHNFKKNVLRYALFWDNKVRPTA